MRYNLTEKQETELSTVITNIASGPFGSSIKVSCFVSLGFPLLDGANLKGFKVTDNITKFVTEEKAHSLEKSIAHRGDVVSTIRGTLGQIAYVPENSRYTGYLISQSQFRITFDKEKVYPPYIVFYFHTRQGQQKLLSFASQVGVPALAQPLKNFPRIKMFLPDLNVQKRLATIIESINNKIELNNQINDNLQQQARIIFQEWISKNTSVMMKLSEIATINPETYSTKDDWSFVNYLDTSSITCGMISEIQYIKPSENKLPSRARRILRKGDIVFSTVRPNQLHYGIIAYPKPNMLGSTGFAVIRSRRNNIPNEIIYLALTEQTFVEQMQQLAEQSVSTFPSIRPTDLDACCIPEPLQEDNNTIASIKTIFDIIAENNEENQRLSMLRDTLLPRLMSGEIDVSAITV